jgi:hypothetical protein
MTPAMFSRNPAQFPVDRLQEIPFSTEGRAELPGTCSAGIWRLFPEVVLGDVGI